MLKKLLLNLAIEEERAKMTEAQRTNEEKHNLFNNLKHKYNLKHNKDKQNQIKKLLHGQREMNGLEKIKV